MLSEMDSDEITEWMVMDNLKHWENVIEQKRVSELDEQSRSSLMMATMFGKTKGEMSDGRQ